MTKERKKLRRKVTGDQQWGLRQRVSKKHKQAQREAFESLRRRLDDPATFEVTGAVEELPAGQYVVEWGLPDHGIVFGYGIVVVAAGLSGAITAFVNPKWGRDPKASSAVKMWCAGYRMVRTGTVNDTGEEFYRFEVAPPFWSFAYIEVLREVAHAKVFAGEDGVRTVDVNLISSTPGEKRRDLPGAVCRARWYGGVSEALVQDGPDRESMPCEECGVPPRVPCRPECPSRERAAQAGQAGVA